MLIRINQCVRLVDLDAGGPGTAVNSPGPDTERTCLPMQENPTPTPAERQWTLDGAILGLLIDLDSPRPWSVDEIAREIGEDVTDSLNRLYGAGLAHRLDGFVSATRAAIVADEIAF